MTILIFIISIHFKVTFIPEYKEEGCDLTKYVYRQRTLQLLYKTNEFCKNKHDNNENNGHLRLFRRGNGTRLFKGNKNENVFGNVFENGDEDDEETLLKNQLKSFMKEMKQYICEKDLKKDEAAFMNNLCDDIYICYRTFKTQYGFMYSTARQTSQGSQRSYTVSSTPDDYSGDYYPDIDINDNTRYLPFKRDTNYKRFDFNVDTDLEDHSMTNFNDTPYLTTQSKDIMDFINTSVEM